MMAGICSPLGALEQFWPHFLPGVTIKSMPVSVHGKHHKQQNILHIYSVKSISIYQPFQPLPLQVALKIHAFKKAAEWLFA